jgi:hypothetical protein
MIAGEEERLALLIPAGKGKAAHQVINKVEAPPHPGVGEEFVVRSGLGKPKLARQLVVIVEPQVGDKVSEDRCPRRLRRRRLGRRGAIVAGAENYASG